MNPTTLISERKRKFWGSMIWISAIFLVISACTWIAASLVKINLTHTYLTMRIIGSAAPAEYTAEMFTALVILRTALLFALASLVLFIAAIVRHRKFSNPNLAG